MRPAVNTSGRQSVCAHAIGMLQREHEEQTRLECVLASHLGKYLNVTQKPGCEFRISDTLVHNVETQKRQPGSLENILHFWGLVDTMVALHALFHSLDNSLPSLLAPHVLCLCL